MAAMGPGLGTRARTNRFVAASRPCGRRAVVVVEQLKARSTLFTWRIAHEGNQQEESPCVPVQE